MEGDGHNPHFCLPGTADCYKRAGGRGITPAVLVFLGGGLSSLLCVTGGEIDLALSPNSATVRVLSAASFQHALSGLFGDKKVP